METTWIENTPYGTVQVTVHSTTDNKNFVQIEIPYEEKFIVNTVRYVGSRSYQVKEDGKWFNYNGNGDAGFKRKDNASFPTESAGKKINAEIGRILKECRAKIFNLFSQARNEEIARVIMIKREEIGKLKLEIDKLMASLSCTRKLIITKMPHNRHYSETIIGPCGPLELKAKYKDMFGEELYHDVMYLSVGNFERLIIQYGDRQSDNPKFEDFTSYRLEIYK